jgi:hypothetical protein
MNFFTKKRRIYHKCISKRLYPEAPLRWGYITSEAELRGTDVRSGASGYRRAILRPKRSFGVQEVPNLNHFDK